MCLFANIQISKDSKFLTIFSCSVTYNKVTRVRDLHIALHTVGDQEILISLVSFNCVLNID